VVDSQEVYDVTSSRHTCDVIGADREVDARGLKVDLSDGHVEPELVEHHGALTLDVTTELLAQICKHRLKRETVDIACKYNGGQVRVVVMTSLLKLLL